MSMFRILEKALDVKELSALAAHLQNLHVNHPDCRPEGQTGFTLDITPWITCVFDKLCIYFPHNSRLRLNQSSCRWQRPTGQGALGLHQDWVALGCKEDVAGGIAWVPLCEIDDDTPTLEVCALDPGRFFPHYMNDAGYSVIEHSREMETKFPLHAIAQMHLGDVLLMQPRTLHRTCVRPGNSKPRLSLDLRFM